MFTRTKGPSTRCSTKCSNSNGKVPTRLRQTQPHVRSGVTSLAGYLADPKRLLTVTRSHWGSEHGLHHRRDVTSAAKTTLRFVWAMRRKCWRSSTLSCLDSLLDKVRPLSLMSGAMRASHLDKALVRLVACGQPTVGSGSLSRSTFGAKR